MVLVILLIIHLGLSKMSIEYIKSQLSIIIENYPFHKSLNDRIIKDSENLAWTRDIYNTDGGLTNVRALQTFKIDSSKNVKRVEDWAISLIRQSMYGNNSGTKFVSIDTWMTNYSKDDFTVSHQHNPSTYAFDYFLKCPKGSSPLVFTTSGKKIKAEEGKIVIFPGNVLHHVPKNKCEGRMTLAGNIFAYYGTL